MNSIKRIPIFETVLVVAILSLHLYAALADAYAFPNNWFVRDDAYYYFKVAQNIVEGKGSTFDGINLSNGYHPLWMLICIPIFALAKYDLILPLRVLLMVIAVIHAATAVMLYRLIKEYLSHAVAILAAVFWSFNFYIHSTIYEMGLETPIAAFSVVFVIYNLSLFEKDLQTSAITLKKIAWLGFLAAIAMFSRLDLIFFAVIVGVWVVFRGTSIRSLLPIDLAVIFLSMTSSVILRTGFPAYNTTYAPSAVEATLIAAVLKILALYFLGGYQTPHLHSIWKTLRKIFFALLIGSALTAVVYILFVQFGLGRNFPRSAFALDFIFSLILISASRLATAWFANPSQSHTNESPIAQLKSTWTTWLREGLSFYGVLGGLLIAYMVFNHIIFGTSSPVSGQIKRWWGSMENSAYERSASKWSSYLGLDEGAFETGRPYTDLVWELSSNLRSLIRGSDMVDERFFAVLITFTFLWLLLVFLNKDHSKQAFIKLGLIPLAAGSVIHILSYTATAYGGAKEWYWVSQMIFLTFALSLFLDLVLKPVQRVPYFQFLFVFIALLYGLNSTTRFWGFINYAMPHGRYSADQPLMEAITFIETNTQPGEIIGMTGGGNVGYFIQDRTIVNMDGLINSYEYFEILRNGEAPVYLRERGMTVLFANPRFLNLPPYFGQFDPYLERYGTFGEKDLLYLLPEPKQ
ncbi:MAG: glycosyltransferase family 39 protein [Anaerolineae bacterium]|nr:glycosyltransferase family 39 protein [Anaerolineae bacterium]